MAVQYRDLSAARPGGRISPTRIAQPVRRDAAEQYTGSIRSIPTSNILGYQPAIPDAGGATGGTSGGGGTPYMPYTPYGSGFGPGLPQYPFGGGYPSFPTGGTYLGAGYRFTGEPTGIPTTQASLPVPDWMCGILTGIGVGCTWSDAVSAGLAYFTGGSDPGQSTGGKATCPPGFEIDADSGECKQSGVGGTVARIIPGGDTGYLGAGGEAVVGSFGRPALVPAQVGSVTKNSGVVSPILRCARGYVLGQDNLCYPKGSIPRQFRKWRPPTKPPMSASDAKALRRIGTLQKRVKRLAGSAGMSCKKR